MSLQVLETSLLKADPETGELSFNFIPDRRAMRDQIIALKDRLLTMEGKDFEVEHVFCDGTYSRLLFIPKGSLLVGKVHLKDCTNIVAKGDISLLTEFGTKRVQAGFAGVSRAGIMKVGYAHEDTIFVNVFRTDETDLEKVEAEIACEDPERFLIEERLPCRSLG
jgi:hypothetical protein